MFVESLVGMLDHGHLLSGVPLVLKELHAVPTFEKNSTPIASGWLLNVEAVMSSPSLFLKEPVASNSLLDMERVIMSTSPVFDNLATFALFLDVGVPMSAITPLRDTSSIRTSMVAITSAADSFSQGGIEGRYIYGYSVTITSMRSIL